MEGKKIKIVEADGLPKIVLSNGETEVVEVDVSPLNAYTNSLNTDDAQAEVYLMAEDVFYGVNKELQRQYEKWGPQNLSPLEWNSVTMEEYGEMCEAINKASFEGEGPEMWDEAIKEGIEMITCAVQLLNEIRRRQNAAGDGQ